VQGQAGRPAFDPRLLISLWLYSYSAASALPARSPEGVNANRHSTANRSECANHHTLSDFRIEHREAVDLLFTQVLAVLSSESLVTLERVTHDGTKIYANASKRSFCGKKRIEEHLKIAREQVQAMGEPDIVHFWGNWPE
jgi:transposase